MRLRLLLLCGLAAGMACGQQEAAKNIRYDPWKGVLEWDAHEVRMQDGRLAPGKKIFHCRIDFEALRMSCGNKSYPISIEEAQAVEPALGRFLGGYIGESMRWFYRGGVYEQTPATGKAERAAR